MSDLYWIGGTTAVPMVDRFTPANVEIGDVFTLTATAEDGTTTAAVNFTATAATVANVTAGLVVAWNASTNSLHTGITAADATTSLTLTADTAGVPFSVAGSATDGGGLNTQTLTRAAVTPNAGPNDFGTAANWSSGAVPVDADSVTIDGRSTKEITYGLNQSSVDLASLRIKQANAYNVGTTSYYLRIGATSVKIGEPAEDGATNASGAQVINLDLGTAGASTVEVYNTRNTGSGGLPVLNLKGAHASHVLRVRAGSVGIATIKPDDTANFPVVSTNGGYLKIASGTSALTTLTQSGGKVRLEAAATTVDQTAGELQTEGSGTITTANIGGKCIPNSTGTITTLNVQDKGLVDFGHSDAARTVTNANAYGSGRIEDPRNVVNWTNGVDCRNGAETKQVNFGTNKTVTPSAV